MTGGGVYGKYVKVSDSNVTGRVYGKYIEVDGSDVSGGGESMVNTSW